MRDIFKKTALARLAALGTALGMLVTATPAAAQAVAVSTMGGVTLMSDAETDLEEDGVQVSVGKAGVSIENLYYETSAACIGEDIYFVQENTLYVLRAGSEKAEPYASYEQSAMRYFSKEDVENWDEHTLALASSVPAMIFSDGETLYGLSVYDGTFGPLDADGLIEKQVALNWSEMEGTYGIRSMQSVQMLDGKLYALLEPKDTSNGYSSDDMENVCFDLTTGEMRTLALQGDYALASYKDGKLLAYSRWGSDENGVQVFDPETGELGETLVPVKDYGDAQSQGIGYDSGGLAYDPENDIIYFVENNAIKTYVNGAIEEIAYIPVNYASNIQQSQIVGGRYFCAVWGSVYLRSLEKEDQPERILRISGGYTDDTTRNFSTSHPDTPVVFINNWYSGAEAVRNDMLSGSSDIDIYVMDVSGGVRSLMEKGYLQDLSASQVLADDVARMYPQIANALTLDGKLYAYPFSFSMQLWAINKQVWDEFDLGDYPSTFLEYVELIKTWEEDYAEDNPDYTVTSLYNGKEEMFAQALLHYIYQYEREDEAISFDTPAFRETMEAIEALDIDPVDWVNMTDSDREEFWEKMSRPSLFTMNVYQTVEEGGEYYRTADGSYEEFEQVKILPPVFEEGQEPIVPASMSVFIVNPASENVDLALEFLEYYAQNADDTLRYAIHTDLSEPVRPSYYEQNRKETEKWIAQMEENLETVEDEVTRKSIEENIAQQRLYLEESEKNDWRISEKSLANYRELAGNMVIPTDSMFFGANAAALEVLQGVLGRYLDGQIGIDVFIREMDQKVKMIYLEGK